MIQAISDGLTAVIGWIGTFIQSLLGTVPESGTGTSGALGALLPLVGIGIAVSAVMLGIRVVRSFTWGA